jgi:ABC-2 type transport system ATP-binding protein
MIGGYKMDIAISVNNLVKKYNNHTALKGINFTVNKGEIFALLGGNGAGKTTTLECIEGFRKFDSGQIEVLGFSPNDPKIRTISGVQLQSTSLPENITSIEALKLFSKWNNVPVNLELFNTFGLKDLQSKQYKTMSTGQKRRLHLALALINDPKVIFLDEPTAGLDVEGRISLHEEIRKLKEQGKTIIIASHDMAEVEALCDRVAIIKDGNIAFIGTPNELASSYNSNNKIHIKSIIEVNKKDFSSCEYNCIDKGYAIYSTKNIGDGLLEILEYMKKNKNTAIDIKIERPSLEESFIEIAKGE